MNKLLTKIVGAALGLSMTVGVGVAIASQNNGVSRAEAAVGDKVTFTYTTSSSKKISTTIGGITMAADSGGYSISATTSKTGSGAIQNSYQSTYSGQQIGTGGNVTSTFTFTFGNPWSGNGTYKDYTKINKVSLSGSNGKSTSYSVSATIGGEAATNSNGVNTLKVGSGNGVNLCEFTPASGHDSGVIAITVTNVSGTAAWYFCSLSIEAEVPDTGLEDKQITYTSSSNVELQTTGTTTSQISGLNVEGCTFSSNNTSVATVSNTGLITAAGVGSTTITISHANDSSYHYLDATVNVSVVRVYDYSTTLGVVSFTDAYAATPASGDSDPMMVVGHIGSITNNNYGNGTLLNTNYGDKTLTIYTMKDVNGNVYKDMTAHAKPVVDDVVVLEGVFCFYNSTTWEIKNAVVRQLNGTVYNYPVVLSSIAVKTAPTKTIYKSGAAFDATGLVITATYSDSTTVDVAYNDHASDFSFSPSTITSDCDVTITYGGKTCTQAVTLATITNVTGVHSAPSEVAQNGSIKPADVILDIQYSDSSTGTIAATSVTVDTSVIKNNVEATATYSGATGTKTATFYVNVVAAPVYVDISDNIDRPFTGVSSGGGYSSWSNKHGISDAVYSGNTAGQNDSIQMNSSSTTGLYTTTSGGKLYSVSVTFNSSTSNGRSIKVYGKDSAFTSISTTGATELGTISKGTSTSVVDEDLEYEYLLITGAGSAVYVDEIVVTWKINGTDNPMTANPTLTLGKSTINVGKNTTLTVATTPADSDELLDVSSADETIATVSGSGKSYTVNGVAVGTTSITVKGKQSGYQSSIAITVSAPTKTYEDKLLTPEVLSIGASYESGEVEKEYESVAYGVKDILKSNGFQFKGGSGYIYNKEALYSTNNIKSITLIMQTKNSVTPKVYEGNSANPSTSVSPNQEFDPKGVNTYEFSGSTQYFKIEAASNATYVEKIIIEMENGSNSVLAEARGVASAILTALKNVCGGNEHSGVVTQSQWDALNTQITTLNPSADAKLLLKNAERICLDNLSQGGAEIENAMAHYDACVTKFGYTPFAGITNATPAQSNSAINIISNNANSSAAIISVIAVLSLSAVAGYFMLRKRKEQ